MFLLEVLSTSDRKAMPPLRSARWCSYFGRSVSNLLINIWEFGKGEAGYVTVMSKEMVCHLGHRKRGVLSHLRVSTISYTRICMN